MSYKPPICPSCKEPLVIVFQKIYQDYSFDEIKGYYTHDDYYDDVETLCTQCTREIPYEIFLEGVLNYLSEGLD